MDTFLKAAVPYLTFEHGQDPLYVARKQGFIKYEPSGPLYRDDILYPLLRMTYVDIPKSADLAQLAIESGIMPADDDLLRKNAQITADIACQMIVNARNAWYARLEAEKPAEPLDMINYYISNSTYSYPLFSFSEDGQVLWYNVGGEWQAVNVSDGTTSSRVPPDRPSREEYPASGDENATDIYDNAGVLRAVTIELAKRRNYITDKYVLYREGPNDPWKRIVDFDLAVTRDFEVIGFTADNERMLVKTNFYDNYVAIYEIDPRSMSRELVYRNEHADVPVDMIALLAGIPSFGLKHPKTGVPLTALYIDDKLRLVCLDADVAAIADNVFEDLGENHFPVAISPEFDYVVLMHRDDRDYGSYRLYNVKTRTAALLLSSDIPIDDIGHTYPVSFRASDGATVFAYLTVPLGKSPRNLPLLINVHGGPQARFTWAPNEHALLASNLGIAVLSVDFRFSSGYGNEYTDTASQNMLLAQQDVCEGVQWAVENGIADPKCIGIMGHSYGGFISFYQAAVHPDTYKAVISLMGVWDWTDLGVELTDGAPVPDYHKCSAPEPHTALARVLSPSSYVDALKAPILIVYSGSDDAVYPSQNIRAIRELTEAGNTPQAVYLPNDGHMPGTVESITETFEAMRRFLIERFLEED
jgi:pimeloyl-ACP methyl ester carboxylesterase